MEKSCETCKYNPEKNLDACFHPSPECTTNEYISWEPFIKNPFDNQIGGSHYKKEGVMDVTEWCMSHDIDIGEFNVIKYVFRHEKKNGIEDLRKARHYLEMIAYMKYKENL